MWSGTALGALPAGVGIPGTVGMGSIAGAGAAALPVPPSSGVRSFRLLERNHRFEIWLIQWPAGGSIELHDHGGSSGGLWVLQGALVEHFVSPEGVVEERTLSAGQLANFGPTHVHDVHNAGPQPAVSLHTYAPPLRGMTYYDLFPGGEPVPIRWETGWRD